MRHERGFMLLEVLVAFTIAALALAVLFDGTLGGLRATRIAGSYQEAVARARSHLAALDSRATRLVPGDQQGDDGSGFHWRTRVVPLATTVVGTASQPPMTGGTAVREVLYSVSATISWQEDGRQRQVMLESQRLGMEAPR